MQAEYVPAHITVNNKQKMESTMKPIISFKSHIEGKNADVTVYPDRIEWEKGSISGGKVALGVLTSGVSLLKTGVSGKQSGSEIIPVKSISSVTSKKDGLRYTKVSVICSGNTIDFRVRHDEAQKVKNILTELMLGTHPLQSSTSATQSSPSDTSQGDAAEQLRKLGELRDSGLLTSEEFEARKAALLDRL